MMMKKNSNMSFTLSVVALAVQTVLLAMVSVPLSVMAADDNDEVTALTRPTNSIELGVMKNSNASGKFGEYNGLNKSNPQAITNINVHGGDSYGQDEGTQRWSVMGTDLGTSARELGLKVEEQGGWKLGIKYDELTHQFGNSYQTPYQGGMGSDNFALPNSFGIINATAVTNSNSQLVGTRNLSNAQQAAFQSVNVSSTRKNSTFNAGVNIDSRWNVEFDYNRLEQNGAKLMGASSSAASTGSGAAGTWQKEAMVTLMNPTNYTTDTFNLAANWVGDKSYMAMSYFGSYFRDGYSSVSWMNPIGTGSSSTGATTTTLAGGYQPNMLSTMPGNNFGQINLNGGTELRPGTKLVMGYSQGRNTQNEGYLNDLMQTGGLPQTSLQGHVDTKMIHAKLTEKYSKDLMLSLAFKSNERDNQSTSNVYKYIDLGGVNRMAINTPLSNRKNNTELAADYRIGSSNNLRLSWDHEQITRWCNNVAGYGLPANSSTGGYSPAGANCAVVPHSTEDKAAFNYRLKATDDVSFNLAYSHAHRIANYDNSAITPLGTSKAANVLGTVNAADYPGYVSFFSASRDQDQIKIGTNWQATELVNMTLSGRYSDEKYLDNPLGVQNGHSTGLNFDSTYNYSENGSATLYLTRQSRSRNMLSGASGGTPAAVNAGYTYASLVAPSNVYSNKLNDQDQTFGLNAKRTGMMGGKFELVADFSVTVGRTQYNTGVPYLSTCSATTTLSCGDTPEIYSRITVLKLRGSYKIDKVSTVTVGYWNQRMTASDYYYNGLQTGYTSSSLLPTNQNSGSYSVNAIAASFIHNF
jgi:MtrB/PioB family decaheme-associated outer membrane protein